MDIVKQHIDSFKTFQKQPKPTRFIINDMPDSVQDLLARFQLKIKEFRIRVREFLRDFDLYFCKLFDGARHDSGDPFEWGERLLQSMWGHRHRAGARRGAGQQRNATGQHRRAPEHGA